MHQRAALTTGENSRVELLLQPFFFRAGIGLTQDQAATRAAQGLVGGRGDHISKRQRIWIETRRHQASNMGHIDKEVGTHLVRDLTEARPINDLRVCGEARHDHFRLMLKRQRFNLVIVDLTAGLVQTVLDRVVDLAGKVDMGTVGQMTTVSQAHPQYGIARLAQGHIDGGVGLRTGVRLDVGVVGAEQLFSTINGQLLNHIHMLTTAVITLSGVAFGILVSQQGSLRFHHQRAGVVFGGDQLNMLLLTHRFTLDRIP